MPHPTGLNHPLFMLNIVLSTVLQTDQYYVSALLAICHLLQDTMQIIWGNYLTGANVHIINCSMHTKGTNVNLDPLPISLTQTIISNKWTLFWQALVKVLLKNERSNMKGKLWEDNTHATECWISQMNVLHCGVSIDMAEDSQGTGRLRSVCLQQSQLLFLCNCCLNL